MYLSKLNKLKFSPNLRYFVVVYKERSANVTSSCSARVAGWPLCYDNPLKVWEKKCRGNWCEWVSGFWCGREYWKFLKSRECLSNYKFFLPSLISFLYLHATSGIWSLRQSLPQNLNLSLRALKCVREIVMVFNPRLRLLKIHSSIIIEFIF